MHSARVLADGLQMEIVHFGQGPLPCAHLPAPPAEVVCSVEEWCSDCSYSLPWS